MPIGCTDFSFRNHSIGAYQSKQKCGDRQRCRPNFRITEIETISELIPIDFESVLVASVSFMDEAFGKLALEHTKEDLQKKLKFDNIRNYDRALINDIFISRFRQKSLGENGPSLKRKKVARVK